MGRFVPGFQPGIGCQLTIAAIQAVKCSSFNADAIFPIRPRNRVWGFTLTVVELETSEEKAALSACRKPFLCCCWDDNELRFAWFTISKQTKEETAQVPGAYSEADQWQLKWKCFVEQKNLNLKPCLPAIHRVQNSSEQFHPAAICHAGFNVAATLLSPRQSGDPRCDWPEQEPGNRTLRETSVHFHSASCWCQNLVRIQDQNVKSAAEPRLRQL